MMTTEAVRGAEWYRLDPEFPNDAPLHNVEVAFTRNVVGPMDYTPVTFSDGYYDHITTNAHELALSVVFESGLLHLADEIASYEAQPQVVQDFLMEVPAAWDEIRFVEGDPASHIVLARRNSTEWYLGGLNGTGSPRDVSIDLTQFGYSGSGGTRISDGSTPRTFESGPIAGTLLELTMSPYGGFVARLPGDPATVLLPPIDDVGPGNADRTSILLDAIHPNPFATATQITFTLPIAAVPSLSIFDAAGRRVRVLVDAARCAGIHRVTWDGTDEAGITVPGGVYFCRLRVGEQSVARRVQRLQ
jgi:hypothetical protein